MFLSGGTYKITVLRSAPKKVEEQCHQFSTDSQTSMYHFKGCCRNQLTADSFTVLRTNNGSLRLNEIYLDGCCDGHYGVSCTKCNKSCSSCDAANGKCLTCADLYYGENCENKCPYDCSNGGCHRETGDCYNCHFGFYGPTCQQCLAGKYGVNCTGTCSDLCQGHCDAQTGACPGHQINSTGRFFRQGFLSGESILMFGAAMLALTLVTVIVGIRTQCFKRILQKRPKRCISYQEEIVMDPRNMYDTIYDIVPYVNNFESSDSVAEYLEKIKTKTVQMMEYEFKGISSTFTNTSSCAVLPDNRRKNRFEGIYPYDFNRVVLDMTEFPSCTDYVNASRIHGFVRDKLYITTQDPFNHETTLLFWETVWQTGSSKILMFTTTKQSKRNEYWPKTEERIGRITVRQETIRKLQLVTCRSFVLEKGEETRRVNHYQLIGWSQNIVPSNVNKFLQFYNLSKMEADATPIVVHCSSGVGKTGAYIAFDYLMDEANETGRLNLPNCILNLRKQRPLMIQTLEEYRFLHTALAENLTHVYSEVTS
ncbi:receptor-type tyrosine-protein phosphatase epsilon-like isoform X2 [Crassostrea virginica]